MPCPVASDPEPARNTLTQLSENLQRSNLKLLDVAQALKRCIDESGLSQAELAKELAKVEVVGVEVPRPAQGRGTVESGAREEGHLGNSETDRMFGRLAPAQQEKLLRRARKESEAISHAEVAKLDRRQAKARLLSLRSRRPIARAAMATQTGGADLLA